MSEWREVKLNDYLEATSSKRIFAKEYVETGIPFYRSKEIIEKEHGKEINNPLYISTERFNEIKNKFSTPVDGDILMSAVGERSGIPYVVSNDGDFYFKDGNLIWLKDFKKDLSSAFLYRWFKSKYGQHILSNSMIGSAQRALTIQGIKNLVIQIPPLKEQKAIAEVLSSLDDKIDLLHHQNKTLEELAQTLFREWFVEEAGEGWEECKLRDFATHKKISIKPAQNPNDNFLHFSLPTFDTNKEPNITIGSDIKSNKYQVEPFSILMSKLNPKTSRVWDIYFEPKENSICSTEFQVVQPNNKSLFPFISTLLKSAKVTGELAMSSSGTSGSHQRVKPEDIFNINFVTPSIDRMKEFSELLEPNYLKQMKNQNQIKTLENMRDTLLPKLMSGEVRVKF